MQQLHQLTKVAAAPPADEGAAAPPADEGADGGTNDNNEESSTAPAEECTPPEVLNPDTNQCEAPQQPADEGAAAPPADEGAAAPPADEGADGGTNDNNEESSTAPAEECTPPEVLNPDTNQCEAPQQPADEGAAAPPADEGAAAPPADEGAAAPPADEGANRLPPSCLPGEVFNPVIGSCEIPAPTDPADPSTGSEETNNDEN